MLGSGPCWDLGLLSPARPLPQALQRHSHNFYSQSSFSLSALLLSVCICSSLPACPPGQLTAKPTGCGHRSLRAALGQ